MTSSLRWPHALSRIGDRRRERSLVPVPISPSDKEQTRLDRFLGTWPPGLLVFVWPQMFVGSETGEQKQVEVALLALAEAGLVDLFTTRRWGSTRRNLRVFARDDAGRASSAFAAPNPWVWQRVLAEAMTHRAGHYGERLSHLRPLTRQAALGRGLLHLEYRRQSRTRTTFQDPSFADRTQQPAAVLAQRWAEFVGNYPEVHDAMIHATSIPDGVV
jgi:hypothetical protein